MKHPPAQSTGHLAATASCDKAVVAASQMMLHLFLRPVCVWMRLHRSCWGRRLLLLRPLATKIHPRFRAAACRRTLATQRDARLAERPRPDPRPMLNFRLCLPTTSSHCGCVAAVSTTTFGKSAARVLAICIALICDAPICTVGDASASV